LVNVGPEMLYQALFDEEAFMQNEDVYNIVYPMV
jgi:hypothetical protein